MLIQVIKLRHSWHVKVGSSYRNGLGKDEQLGEKRNFKKEKKHSFSPE